MTSYCSIMTMLKSILYSLYISESGPARFTSPDGAVDISSANGLVGTGFAS